jgi:hypothetical protein
MLTAISEIFRLSSRLGSKHGAKTVVLSSKNGLIWREEALIGLRGIAIHMSQAQGINSY